MLPTPDGETTQATGARRQSAARRLSRVLIRARTDPPGRQKLIVIGMAMVSPPAASAKPALRSLADQFGSPPEYPVQHVLGQPTRERVLL